MSDKKDNTQGTAESLLDRVHGYAEYTYYCTKDVAVGGAMLGLLFTSAVGVIQIVGPVFSEDSTDAQNSYFMPYSGKHISECLFDKSILQRIAENPENELLATQILNDGNTALLLYVKRGFEENDPDIYAIFEKRADGKVCILEEGNTFFAPPIAQL